MALQRTHRYHEILKPTKLWQEFAAAMEQLATESPAYRARKLASRQREDNRRDAAWRPPEGGTDG